MDEDQVVEYYCRACNKDVKCKLFVWVMAVTLSTPYKTVTEVSAKCPHCLAVLARGDAIVELS